MLRHYNYFVTSHRAEVHYYIAYSIIFCELKWHCYHPKQVMNTGFPVCILRHLNQVTICFIVIILKTGAILGVRLLGAIIVSSRSDVSPAVMFRRNRRIHLENISYHLKT